MNTVMGDSLEPVTHLTIAPGTLIKPNEGQWSLKGTRSNLRYTKKLEEEKLVTIQADLGRPTSTCAALIPIRKAETWWKLSQDERREIFEQRSKHIKTGLKYLPAIARKLYHCRELNEPFDFLTWFEYAPSDSDAFEELVSSLRKTPEWGYVTREVDIRLTRT